MFDSYCIYMSLKNKFTYMIFNNLLSNFLLKLSQAKPKLKNIELKKSLEIQVEKNNYKLQSAYN